MSEGQSIYYAGKDAKTRRTVRLVVSVALERVPEVEVFHAGEPVGPAYLYSCRGDVSDEQLDKIRTAIRAVVAENIPVTPVNLSAEEFEPAVPETFTLSKRGARRVAAGQPVPAFRIGESVRWAFGEALASTGELDEKELFVTRPSAKFGRSSFVVAFVPEERYREEPALVGSTSDIIRWADGMDCNSLADLNDIEAHSSAQSDFALHSEFRQDMKVSDITNMVLERGTVRLICIAGPTSSGKTTFATKLSMCLRNHGLRAFPLTVDHYYLPLDRQPKYQARKLRSDVDYDAIESMDVDLINQHLNALLAGKKVNTPNYDMKTGYRVEPGHEFQIPEGGILVIEGIHALNPQYTKTLSSEKVFKIFLSPITQLRVDETSVMKSTDSRLFRRMCRDFLFRGHSGSKTLRMWENVRRGEDKWIFPFQNDTDYVMNSALEYEICVLKSLSESILHTVPRDDDNYATAQRLLGLLSRVNAWDTSLVPRASILREFLGGGAFDKH